MEVEELENLDIDSSDIALQTVATAPKTVATVVNPEKGLRVGAKYVNTTDKALKDLKGVIQAFDNNIRIGHGKKETNIKNMLEKFEEVDTILKTESPSPAIEGDIFNYILSLKNKYGLK